MSLYPSPGVKCEKVNDRKQTQTDTTSPLGLSSGDHKMAKRNCAMFKMLQFKIIFI